MVRVHSTGADSVRTDSVTADLTKQNQQGALIALPMTFYLLMFVQFELKARKSTVYPLRTDSQTRDLSFVSHKFFYLLSLGNIPIF